MAYYNEEQIEKARSIDHHLLQKGIRILMEIFINSVKILHDTFSKCVKILVKTFDIFVKLSYFISRKT